MTTTPRRFSSTNQPKPPIPVEVAGTYRVPPADGPNEWVETFSFLGDAPPAAADALGAGFLEISGKMEINPRAIFQFFRASLATDDDRRRFDALIEDRDRFVEMSLLGDVMVYVAEQMIGRPITPRG